MNKKNASWMHWNFHMFVLFLFFLQTKTSQTTIYPFLGNAPIATTKYELFSYSLQAVGNYVDVLRGRTRGWIYPELRSG